MDIFHVFLSVTLAVTLYCSLLNVRRTWRLIEDLSSPNTRMVNLIKDLEDRSGECGMIPKSLSAASTARVFVIEGTAAWNAWLAVVAERPPCIARDVAGLTVEGAFFPSLFPPSDKSAA